MKVIELNSIELFVVCEALEEYNHKLKDIVQTLASNNNDASVLQQTVLDVSEALLVEIKAKGRELT